ncbi:MAG: HD domain-containing protein [Thermomicrobiales bacterium]|nr:HD domain-containing protein [Thermomicrobiales bacterium]MCO5219483.1 HD domain-containing protein [Thermomicrobiales bacterium]MCO5228455.1 HD domain-containing protein [Thermomicrobiales bacterium]
MTIFTPIGAFFAETDRLKETRRACWIYSERRHETVAEHVWHATLLALINRDLAPDNVDHNHVRDLLTVHDLVEVYAGDTSVWDENGNLTAADREQAAGERLMRLLPPDSTVTHCIDSLWREFQDQQTINAQWARSIDSLHPLYNSWAPGAAGHPRSLTPDNYRSARKRVPLDRFGAIGGTSWWLINQAMNQGLMPIADDLPLSAYDDIVELMTARTRFVTETDALKTVMRANHILAANRDESVAEHCWQTTLLALLWRDHIPAGVDINRVMDLLVVHDLVEVYAGDIPIELVQDWDAVRADEDAARTRLIDLLPDEFSRNLVGELIAEFLALETPDSRFARALDVIHPTLMTWGPGFHLHPDYQNRTPSYARMRERKMQHIADYPVLVEVFDDLLEDAIERGFAGP